MMLLVIAIGAVAGMKTVYFNISHSTRLEWIA